MAPAAPSTAPNESRGSLRVRVHSDYLQSSNTSLETALPGLRLEIRGPQHYSEPIRGNVNVRLPNLPDGVYELTLISSRFVTRTEVEIQGPVHRWHVFRVDPLLVNIARPADKLPQDTLVRVSRARCLGPCQPWTLRVDLDGRWDWKLSTVWGSKRRGRQRSGQLRPATVRRLKADLERLRRLGPYGVEMLHDVPWNYVTYRSQGSVFRVRTLRRLAKAPAQVRRLRRRLARWTATPRVARR